MKKSLWGGDIPQQLRALTASAEGPGSNPSTQRGPSDALFWPEQTLHTHVAQQCMQASTQTHKINLK